MQDEIRVSRNGREVAIRNLNHPERSDLKWRCTNGSYKTDADVAAWIPLNRMTEIHLVKTGEYEDAQTIAAFPSVEDASSYIEARKEFAAEKADIGETTYFYPHGSRG
jgi:hypothetical protein